MDEGVGALRLLALDLGERRIGLAVCDPAGTMAFPAGHLIRSKLAQDVNRVLALAAQREVEGIVVGVPYTLAGKTGRQAQRAQRFIRSLQKETSLPVHGVDESYTSVEAEGLLRESGQEPSRRKETVDEAAAMLILERYLHQT